MIISKQSLVLMLSSLALLSACASNPPKENPEPQASSSSSGVSTSLPDAPASDNAEALYTYAQGLEAKGQEQEAIGFYLQATQVDPELLKAHLALAQLYTKFARAEEAKIAYENVLRLDRTHPFVSQYKEARLKFYSAMNIAQNEEYEKALKLISEAPRSTPLDAEIEVMEKKWKGLIQGSTSAKASQDMIEQASLLAYQGKYQEAITLIETAPDASDNSAIQEKVSQWKQALGDRKTPGPQITPPPIGKGNQRFVIGEKVNLRQSPYLYSESLANLNHGSSVELLLDKGYEADGYQWSKVRTPDGKVGWVAANLLNTSLSQVKSPPANLPTSPSNNTSSNSSQTFGTRYIKSSNVNIRRSPSVNGTLVTQGMLNAPVILLSQRSIEADGYQWSKIRLEDGQTGWIANDFLMASKTTSRVIAPGASVPAPRASVPAPKPVASKTRYAYITGTGINLRSAPSTDGKIVSQVSRPSRVVMLNDAPVKAGGYVWQHIQVSDGTKGWLVTQFLGSSAPSAAPAAPAYAHIKGNHVNIRKEPSLSAGLLIQADEGTAVTLLTTSATKKEGYSWYKVRLADGRVGWVASDFLSK